MLRAGEASGGYPIPLGAKPSHDFLRSADERIKGTLVLCPSPGANVAGSNLEEVKAMVSRDLILPPGL